jgi:uncharacterized repeat protein (TIGR03803 family)
MPHLAAPEPRKPSRYAIPPHTPAIQALVTGIFLLSLASAMAAAQTLTTLYTFTNATDGAYPSAGLIRDGQGNLYGTTAGIGNTADNGTVFKITPTGTFSVLHAFAGGSDGASPFAGLLADGKGNFYGATEDAGRYGFGTVFKVTSAGTESVFYSFGGGKYGGAPANGLIWGPNGDLYGVAGESAFTLTFGHKETTLYTFTERGAAGWQVSSRLVRNAQGNFYGTTNFGGLPGCVLGFGCGVVFELTPSGTVTPLYSFTGGADGGNPGGGLVLDEQGNIYGTASTGGVGSCSHGSGCGVVFELTPSGNETVLYSFTGGADGADPDGVLLREAGGNLYGTTGGGGSSGAGTVFEVTSTHVEKALYSFTGGADGSVPSGSLVRDAQGNFYGTTSRGGASSFGTVFKLAP